MAITRILIQSSPYKGRARFVLLRLRYPAGEKPELRNLSFSRMRNPFELANAQLVRLETCAACSGSQIKIVIQVHQIAP
jgi:hypothetical protein